MCDCGQMDLVTDAASGDVVCRQCGMVVEAHIFDEHLEFYSEHAGPRAGPPESWLLPQQPIVFDRVPHRRRLMANPDPHASVRELFDVTECMGRRFAKDVRDTAKLLCRDLAAVKPVRSEAYPVHAACALYLAAKMHGGGVGRSKKEIAAEFRGHGVTERALTMAAKQFKSVLHAAAYAPQLSNGLDAGDLINRCVDRLHVDDEARKAIKRAAHDLVERLPPQLLEGKTPCSVCSGVVGCVLQRLGIKLTKKHVTESCRVSGATLDKMTEAVSDIVMCRA